ncbi:MAG: hypothetical protein ACI90V_009653, partial [Bacillariaceae sp.]
LRAVRRAFVRSQLEHNTHERDFRPAVSLICMLHRKIIPLLPFTEIC